jgi:hypothetical protein
MMNAGPKEFFNLEKEENNLSQVYHLGIIDYLQGWDFLKKGES